MKINHYPIQMTINGMTMNNLTLINMWLSYKPMLPLVRNYISPSLNELSLNHSPPKQHFKKITCKAIKPVEVQPVPPIEEIPIKEEPIIAPKPEPNKPSKQIEKNVLTNLHKLVITILLILVIILLYFLNKSPPAKPDIIIKTEKKNDPKPPPVPKDIEKPSGEIVGINMNYQVGDTISYRITGSDNQQLAEMAFSIENSPNTINNVWKINGQSHTKQGERL